MADHFLKKVIAKHLIKWDRKVSAPQLATKNFLFPYWRHDTVLEEARIPRTLYRLDLVNVTKKIVVEVSPDKVHTKYNEFFHKNRDGFLKKVKDDFKKQEICEREGFLYIELYDEDLKNLTKTLFLEKFGVDL